MGKRTIGKQFSFATLKPITLKQSEKAETMDLYVSRNEALRMIAAITNTLIASPNAQGVRIVGYNVGECSHCTAYPHPYDIE